MRHIARMLGLGLSAAMLVVAGGTVAVAQSPQKKAAVAKKQEAPKKKKSRCKDGQTAEVAKYKLTKGTNLKYQIAKSLTGKPGDPDKGVSLMVHRRLGNCIACHESKQILKKVKAGDNASLAKYGFHGKIAPPLDGAADRYTEGELRLIVVDAHKAFPDADTIMPSFHKTEGLHRVIGDCKGIAMLSPAQVEDIVAFLKTTKE